MDQGPDKELTYMTDVLHNLNLRAINESWQIRYLATTSSQLRHSIAPGAEPTLTLYGSVNDKRKINAWLQRWLKNKAQQHFVPWLQDLSTKHDLKFNRVTIRGQRTLWGSCTHEKNISLNYKLLFLPREYAEHILLHELCHTKHLNHSKRFWNLLMTLDPNTNEYNKIIRKADHFVPQELVRA